MLTLPKARVYGGSSSARALSAVRLDGTVLSLRDGSRWRWRYATAFTLLATDITTFLDWCAAKGFTGVRVLTMAKLTADLPPSDGLARLPALAAALRARGLGAELVALADTRELGLDRDAMRAHVAAVGLFAAAADLPIAIELANENAHPSQQSDLQDPAFLRELRSLIPAAVPVSAGSSCCGQPDTVEVYPGGDYVTVHLNRDRPMWDEVRRVKDLIDTQHDLRRLVVNDEPMGAAEADQSGRRSAHPERFFAQGVLDRLGEIGGTFHSDDGIYARVPGPIQQACADAYIAGATIAPDDQVFAFANDSTGGASTRGADWSRVEKLFTFTNIAGGASYLVALNVTGDYAPTMANGWHLGAVVASRPGIEVREITR